MMDPLATTAFQASIVDDVIPTVNWLLKPLHANPIKLSRVFYVIVLDVLSVKIVLHYVPVLVPLFSLILSEIDPL